MIYQKNTCDGGANKLKMWLHIQILTRVGSQNIHSQYANCDINNKPANVSDIPLLKCYDCTCKVCCGLIKFLHILFLRKFENFSVLHFRMYLSNARSKNVKHRKDVTYYAKWKRTTAVHHVKVNLVSLAFSPNQY